MEVLREFAGPFAARTLRLLLGLHTVRHVAFSRGPHVCPDAYVARRQIAHAALPALLALPGVRLATTDVRYRGWVFRGPARLDVSWDGE